MSRPTDLPIWDTAEERVLQPDITRQTTGWVWGSTKFEKPKGEHFNWWMNNVYKWTAHFDETIISLQNQLSTEVVHNTGDETIDGVKTFTSSPIVPTPTTGTQAVNKNYVDINSFNPTPTIATGTATFTATTNNIFLTGIGIGVEIGDVIQISGADDAKNNSEFTVEVITDNDNIIVNQAHANKGTTKNVANRSNDTDVTVKLLSKYYNAPLGLGQGWVNVSSLRNVNSTYPNNTNRPIEVFIVSGTSGGGKLVLDSASSTNNYASSATASAVIGKSSSYSWNGLAPQFWMENR